MNCLRRYCRYYDRRSRRHRRRSCTQSCLTKISGWHQHQNQRELSGMMSVMSFICVHQTVTHFKLLYFGCISIELKGLTREIDFRCQGRLTDYHCAQWSWTSWLVALTYTMETFICEVIMKTEACRSKDKNKSELDPEGNLPDSCERQ